MCLNPFIVRGYRKETGLIQPVFDRKFYVNQIRDKCLAYKKRGMPFFTYSQGYAEVACGKCPECAASYTRQWQIRICKEAQQHADNCFVTLTYDPAYYPGHLVKDDFRKFIKKLRNKYRNSLKIRFYGVGEYGKKTCRAHYHVALFGYKPTDMIPFFVKKGVTTYLSQEISELWGKGHVAVQELNEQSAAYVAKYMHKLLPVRSAAEVDYPAFSLMSRRPGIGLQAVTREEIERGYISFKKLKASVPRAVRAKVTDLWDKIVREIQQGKKQIEQQRELFSRQRKCALTLEKLIQRNRTFVDLI